jgi:hypothetical protein
VNDYARSGVGEWEPVVEGFQNLGMGRFQFPCLN